MAAFGEGDFVYAESINVEIIKPDGKEATPAKMIMGFEYVEPAGAFQDNHQPVADSQYPL